MDHRREFRLTQACPFACISEFGPELGTKRFCEFDGAGVRDECSPSHESPPRTTATLFRATMHPPLMCELQDENWCSG
jgi:hypothetical protein